MASNGRQNHVMLSSLVDQFISWALPLLRNVSAGDGSTELALESLCEFLNVGDAGAIDRYALPILKASQEILEDERTSWSLLHKLIGILTMISLKFSRSFQPHFVDIVDLLLGWALVPDLAESDRHVIMDSFLQFQKHWVNDMSFPLGLLSKFLGDMDVLLQDASPGTPQQFCRLVALLSCFLTVLQSTASGLLELNVLGQIVEPLSQVLPQLLACLTAVGKKFGWSKWIEDSWRCLTLLAEILRERFCSYYPLTLDILFQSLELDNTNQRVGSGKITSFQVHGVLKTNLQLLSLQKSGLLPSSVQRILQFDMPISQLRLHPNHLVTGSSAGTYIFLLKHGNNAIVDQAVTFLIEEIELLKGMLVGHGDDMNNTVASKPYSKIELFALLKFDLKVMLSCVSLNGVNTLIDQPDIANLYLKRSENLVASIIDKLNPFDLPILACMELQVNIVKTLERLSVVEFLSKCSIRKQFCHKHSVNSASERQSNEKVLMKGHSYIIGEHLVKYSTLLVKALHISSPLTIKEAALEWIHRLCEDVICLYKNSNGNMDFSSHGACGHGVVGNLICSVLDASSDREPRVRAHVAAVLDMLMKARLVHSVSFYSISEVVLEKLGDPDINIKNAFVRLLSHVMPCTMYLCGLADRETITTCSCRPDVLWSEKRSYSHWKQVFALKQLPRQLNLPQLVSILSYLSQRWKVPLSSWIERLILRCQCSKEFGLNRWEETENMSANSSWLDVKVEEDILEKITFVNNLAGSWWAIHEAARFCISMRLRTNLGGPTQTFAALERMLLDIAHLLQLDTEQNDGTLNIIGSSCTHLLPMKLLLDFVEALKKRVYNAYDGSIVLPPANRQSSLFFRANKKVCEEWFSRICEPMMNAGLALQCHDAVIHYCSLRLQELKNLVASALRDKSRTQVAENLQNIRDRFSEEILRVVRLMALALCKRREPEALVGVQKWVSLTFSSLIVEENCSLDHIGILGPFSWMTGLVYQARGQYEKAAAHFTHLLQTEESLSSMGSESVQFAIARVIESYTAVSDWSSLDSWLLELQMLRAKHAGKSYSGALTTAGNEINAIQALARFDEGDVQAAWACLDLTPKSSSELTLDPKVALQRSEQMLLQAMLFQIEGKADKVSHEIQKAKSMLEETLSILPLDSLTEAATYATQLHCIFAFEEGDKFRCGQDQLKEHHSILGSVIQAVQSPINQVHQDCNLWLKVLRVYRNIVPGSPVTLKLCKDLFSLARKQNNLGLANRLHNYLRDHIQSCSEERYRDFLMSNLQYEATLLLHAENKIEDAISNLWMLVHPCVVSSDNIVPDGDDSILKAKACLKLSKWLRQDNLNLTSSENIIEKMVEDFYNADDSFLGRERGNENFCPKSSIRLTVEEIVGAATKLSTCLCPSMGKSWISYASWCYGQARDSLSDSHDCVLSSCTFSSLLHPEITPARFKLTEEERLHVKSVILQLFQKNRDALGINDETETQNIFLESAEQFRTMSPGDAMVKQVVSIIEAAAGAPGADSSNGECLSATVSNQLHILIVRSTAVLDEKEVLLSVDDLMCVWWSLRKRRVSLFGHAAHGFVQYLSYSSSKILDGQLVGLDCDPFEQKSGSYTLRATLYVLHILLNYGLELKDSIEPGLSTIPLLPWQEITPQLFARLSSHPEQVVRKQLEGVLIMLAKLSPWSIVYPTLVDVNSCGEEPPEELQHILSCLSRLYPRLIQDVQLMINELENVTVLWEELWLSTLQDLHTDVMKRINVLKEEAARIAGNVTLSHNEKNKINTAKYSAMMAPIVVALERRLASTSRKPETPHEIWFSEEYIEQLKSAILTFKIPPASIAALGDVWRPFESIAASLASYQRKSSISLGEVAPQLALLSSSDVPMPGLEKQITISDSEGGLNNTLRGIVRIASFSEQVSILSTKTKPKKLVILGSDGEKYAYLLKGREDLRLDARIMQLLQAINGFLYSSPATRSRCLCIRFYSVTPISGRAGLIRWVDNVISIYSVFKAWQTRVQLAQISASGAGNTKDTVPPPVPRPSDMFYGKIIPALKEKGIRRVISRRDWPHEVKRKVLVDLMKEAPRQLLHQELWCASEGFKAFSSKLKRYSGSVAAMSIVGHILGLGDRHLDNILMDFSSGDIVHIDYNVCFDKGQRLKIPEIVPFRLTQTIEAALGCTGIEGNFRANCEAVVGVLRKNKDIILMLLEVFLWDPLVEWTRGDFHDDAAIGGEERKGMELAVSLSLFASRVQEIRVPLLEHHDLLLGILPAVASALERFGDVLNQYELVSALFHRVDQERSNLILNESTAKSIVAEATCNTEKTRASYEAQVREFGQAKAMVAEIAQEATTWMEQHERILDALRSSSIPEIKPCLKQSNMEHFSLTSAVVVAGIPLAVVPETTLAQCVEIDREVSQLIDELNQGLSCAVATLQEYSLCLRRILPFNYLTTSPVNGWAQVLQLSANNISHDILPVARRQASELIAKAHGDDLESVKCSHNDLHCKVEKYTVEIARVEEECTELLNSIGFETESKAKDRLLSAFINYMQATGFARKEDAALSFPLGMFKLDGPKDAMLQTEIEEKLKVLSVFNLAVSSLYSEVKHKVMDMISESAVEKGAESSQESDFGMSLCKFEEQVEKCMLIAGFVSEVRQLFGWDIPSPNVDMVPPLSSSEMASIIKDSLCSCKSLVGQLSSFVLPDMIKSVVSFNSEVMDAFGCLSQIRGSIDTALEQLVNLEIEKESLIELEQNYFVKVSLIAEQQLALEEAAVKGRDNLSWEEAEEIASQEEACRVQLDQLHQSWNQKDLQTSSLIKREGGIKNVLISAERHFESLLDVNLEREPRVLRRTVLLSKLVKPFSELEKIDKALSSFGNFAGLYLNGTSNLADMINSGYPTPGFIWKFSSLLNNHCFFIWKIGVIDYFFDSCIHDVASFLDLNLGFDHLFSVVKKKLEIELQKQIGLYLKERVTPALLSLVDREIEHLKQMTDATNERTLDQIKIDVGAMKQVQQMLEEYCNAHETVRAARSAASVMKRQVEELGEALQKTSLEIVQMEWMYDTALTPSHDNRIIARKFLSAADDLYPIILNLSRPKFLENLQSVISRVARFAECLQGCERTSVTAEGQLEKAMGWACGGPNLNVTVNSSSKSSGIPPEFHDHLMRRHRLLWDVRDNASDIMKICMAVLEFEASRDGTFRIPGEIYQVRTCGHGGRAWQQACLNALTRLEVAYHAFMRTEKEWKLAQSNMEVASSGLFSAANELSVFSMKAKAASGDLQIILDAMKECAYEANVALSSFSHITKGHTALTSECGSMLEEVLAITEGLHDVNNLGKEAAAAHHSLMDNHSKACSILLPLESLLSKDVAAMTDAMSREQGMKIEISPIHGQAIYQSYSLRIREACQTFMPLVPPLTFSVKGLHSMLLRLARIASLHAGNLHKALEGLGESQEVRSQEINLLRPDLDGDVVGFDNKETEEFSQPSEVHVEDLPAAVALSPEDKGWISPPDTIYSSSESSITMAELSVPDSLSAATDVLEQLSRVPDNKQATISWNSVPFSGTDFQEFSYCGQSEFNNPDSGTPESSINIPTEHHKTMVSPKGKSVALSVETCDGVKLGGKNEVSSANQARNDSENQDVSLNTGAGKRLGRGKNAYAMSVLKRVKMKLGGFDISDKREVSIAEQVDYLLKQATSIDNLCNMYEGWTPWI